MASWSLRYFSGHTHGRLLYIFYYFVTEIFIRGKKVLLLCGTFSRTFSIVVVAWCQSLRLAETLFQRSNDCGEPSSYGVGFALGWSSHRPASFAAVRVRPRTGKPPAPADLGLFTPNPKGRATKMMNFMHFHPDGHRGLSGCGLFSNHQTALGAPCEFRPERRGVEPSTGALWCLEMTVWPLGPGGGPVRG